MKGSFNSVIREHIHKTELQSHSCGMGVAHNLKIEFKVKTM